MLVLNSVWLGPIWLAMNCCKVKQGSPLEAPGQGLSAVGMILISSSLAAAVYWMELLSIPESTSRKRANFVNEMHL